MKKYILYFLFLLLNSIPVYSQGLNTKKRISAPETIHQIRVPGIHEITIFQALNQVNSHNAFILNPENKSMGNNNPKNKPNVELINQLNTVPYYDPNDLTIGQTQSSNIIPGIQVSYLKGFQENKQALDSNNFQIDNRYLIDGNTYILDMDSNLIRISGNGKYNNGLEYPQGRDNSIAAQQVGNTQFLQAIQTELKNYMKIANDVVNPSTGVDIELRASYMKAGIYQSFIQF